MKKFMTSGRLALVWLAIPIVTLALTVAFALPATSQAGSGHQKLNPQLAELARTDPSATVRVVVEGVKGQVATDKVENTVAKKHGKKDKSLSIVGGCSAEMTAGDAAALTESDEVAYVTIDAPMVSANAWDSATDGVPSDSLQTNYPAAVNAPALWGASTPITGAGVTVAVIDSGIRKDNHDFQQPNGNWQKQNKGLYLNNRILASLVLSDANSVHPGDDKYGHGTHVAGIIAGSGRETQGDYIGIAPQCDLVDLQVADNAGNAYLSDVIDALQWVVVNRAAYNIKVVNLSLVSQVPEPYSVSPLDAACEIAWLSGVTVVVSEGNSGANTAYFPPANDPFVISVGAVDNSGTVDVSDDSIPAWSGYGTTQDGQQKPEVVAPGRQIVSDLSTKDSVLGKEYRDRIVGGKYLRLSGTSMAAPVVSGAVALLSQAHPDWTPDQMKAALIATARPLSSAGSGAGEIDVAAAANLRDPGYANDGQALAPTIAALAGVAQYPAADWTRAATWNDIDFTRAATWNAATWNAATWNTATWNEAWWNSIDLNSISFCSYPD